MTSPPPSTRARRTPASPIRKLSPFAEKAVRDGKRIYHLNIGQPDVPAPKEFFDGLRSFSDTIIAYEPSRGNAELLAAWSSRINADLRILTSPDNFLITTGASEALIFAFMACADPEDEIIVFDPTYANYLGFAALSGISLVPVPTQIENNFALPDPADIVSRISPRTRAILLCNPNNPTGTVYSEADLTLLVQIAAERNLFLIVDEAYRELVYDGRRPFSVLQLPMSLDHVLVVDSLSKRFSLCGARIGCVMSFNAELLATIRTMAQARLSTATIEQVASAYMLRHVPQAFVETMVGEYENRRNVLYAALRALPDVTVHKPEGAFYCVASLPVPSAEEFCIFLLRDFSLRGATTFLAPASGFYLEQGRGEAEVRVAYVLNTSDIERAIEVVGEALIAFRK